MAEYHFDFSFVRSGPPVVTLSATGIAFNAGARALLGHPDQIDIGYDAQAKAIGVCAHDPSSTSEPFDLEQQTGIRFREKAKQFLPEFDESNKMLIVILDEEHLK